MIAITTFHQLMGTAVYRLADDLYALSRKIQDHSELAYPEV